MARKLEVDSMEDHEVYEWVRIETVGDAEVIEACWNDLRKASGLLRSRAVGRQYNMDGSTGEFFAGTPPLSLIKFVLS